MAEEQEPSGPSLEPPTLFRRKKKDKKADPPAQPPVAPPVDETPTTILDDTVGGTDEDAVDGDMTQPLAAPVPPVADAPPPLFADDVPAPAAEAEPAAPPKPAASPKPPRPPREGPLLPGRVAAAAAGLLAGALIVGLTMASFELCGRLQGTNSCGGPGIFLLLAILVLAVVVGTVVLSVCGVAEPGSTSFLAVGLTSVIALLFLIDALFDWWMLIVIPLVSVATFLLSHWVTATFVEPAKTETEHSPADDDWFHHIR